MSRLVVNKQKFKIYFTIKRFFILIILFFILILFFWLVNINFKLNIIQNYINSISKKYDYLFKEVEIIGLNNISEIEINQYLKKYHNKSIFFIPIKKISKKIEKNNWIESVKLKNDFKNKIYIYIKEFDPIAVYYNGSKYLFINKSGYAIDFAEESEIGKFIIFIGQNANKNASIFIEQIPDQLKSMIIKAQYINNRRWDIYTKEDLKISLPEVDYKKAMNTFTKIYAELYSLDIKKIEYIDFRIPEKAIIKFYNEKD